MIAAPVGNAANKISLATREDAYSYSGNSSALAYGHNPDPTSSLNGYVSLYDGATSVKAFSNSNPNFVLKTALVLPGVAPTVYDMSTAPNSDTTDLGELFKLIPRTVKNVKHHLSQTALSQLSLVANVDVSNNYRRVQVKSKKLGSAGAVEIVGGSANIGSFSVVGDAQEVSFNGDTYMQVNVSAYPSTLNAGDYVGIYNTTPANRLSKLSATDTIDVASILVNNYDFRYNPKQIYSSPWTAWTIADVSGSYSLPTGTAWRWSFNAAGSQLNITSLTNGAISPAVPNDYPATGTTPGTANLKVFSFVDGTVSSPMTFALSLIGQPTQADYFTFQNAGGTTFAAWFDIDSAGTPPSGTPYTSATNKIKVSILSTDSANTIVTKLSLALQANVVFTAAFGSFQLSGTSLAAVNPGDILNVYGNYTFNNTWNMRNLSQETGDSSVSGWPIIAVNNSSSYMDIVNPNGVAMSATQLSLNGTLAISPTPFLQWRTNHVAKGTIVSITELAGTATVLTTQPHGFGVGDSVTFTSAGVYNGTVTITATPSAESFTFTTVQTASVFNGRVIRASEAPTTFRIRSIGFNNLFVMEYDSGKAPLFASSGVSVDDMMVVSGSTFNAANTGSFRVVGVDDTSITYVNPNGVEELHTKQPINELSVPANWVANATSVTGPAGVFTSVTVGSWIKKAEDTDDKFVQVVSFDTGVASTATIANLGSAYAGGSSASMGVVFDQVNGINGGMVVQNTNDIRFYDADSVVINDSLVVENIAASGWFNTSNSGIRDIVAWGSTTPDCRPYVRVVNGGGVVESNRSISANVNGFYIQEGVNNLYSTNRKVEYTSVSPVNKDVRQVYMTPPHRLYKISQAYGSYVKSEGKLGFDTNTVTGVDGYTYYTGLMRTAQRVVDGYSPDPSSYPGYKAVGAAIELLPPLPVEVSLKLQVATNNGVNLTDITNDIKSTIISYISTLGVGQNVVLSEIIAQVMAITGVQSVTFTSPVPSTIFITVGNDQKAYITPELISLS
jgi:hypothetical protein